MARWFQKNAAFDAEIRTRFGDELERASRGELDWWAAAPEQDPELALALVVVLDQFSRNVFRDTPRSFAQDPRALEISERMQTAGADSRLSAIQRYILLLPMMHSESADVQRRGVSAYRALLEEATAAEKGTSAPVLAALAAAVDYAERHEAIIKRFGRFPHRNALLERASSADELAFLLEPGSSF